MIARYLHTYGNNRYSTLYSTAANKYMKQKKEKENNNKLDETEEVIIDQENILEIYEILLIIMI